MIYNTLYKVSGSVDRGARYDHYAETEQEAIAKATEWMSDYDSMTEGFWSKTPLSGAFVSVLQLPNRVFIRRYSQVEPGKWIVDETPYKEPPYMPRC